MISEATETLIRECWKASVPEAFRPTGTRKIHGGAIILPTPPAALLEKWFDKIATHVREKRVLPQDRTPNRTQQARTV